MVMFRCVIEADDGSGSPDGTVIATSNLVDISTFTGAYVDYQFDFGHHCQNLSIYTILVYP